MRIYDHILAIYIALGWYSTETAIYIALASEHISMFSGTEAIVV